MYIVLQVYVDGTTTMSTHERKASIREFYGSIRVFLHFPSYDCLLYIYFLTTDFCNLCYDQLLFTPLYCNFREVLPILRIKNRMLSAWKGTEEEMTMNVYSVRMLTLNEKKNVEYAWRLLARLYCPTATTRCAWNVTVNGTIISFVLLFPFYR